MVYFIFKPINKLHTINYITPLKRFQVKLVSSLCDKSNTVTILATLVLTMYAWTSRGYKTTVCLPSFIFKW